MQFIVKNRVIVAVVAPVLFFLGFFYFTSELKAVDVSSNQPKIFEVKSGDGFFGIVNRLRAEELIRSGLVFKSLSLVTGSAGKLKPGVYRLTKAMTAEEILKELISGSHREITVTIPEGASIYEIEKILNDAGVLTGDGLVNNPSFKKLEGKLFPDTYRFFMDSDAKEVVDKFFANFKTKAVPVLGEVGKNAESDLILASLIQKEVPDYEDQRIVAGILKKRLEKGMPLQVDATICYIKRVLADVRSQNCYPLTPLDFKFDSPYNTYLYKGLPPGPLGNPGISAIKAVLDQKSSPYWFYLSDPKSGKTIFSRNLDEQEQNRVKYLRS